VSHRPGRGGDASHQDQQIGEASTDSDTISQESVFEDLPEDPEIVRDQAAAPACRNPLGVSWERIGGDGATLGLPAFASPRLKITATASDDGPPLDEHLPATRVEQETSADQAGANVPSPCDCGASPRGWDRQEHRRQQERDLRMRSVSLFQELRGDEWSTAEAALVLGLSPRTLSRWEESWETNRLEPKRRGRPPRIAPFERQAEVLGFLKANGPGTSIAVLQAEYSDLARAELSALRTDFRAEWRLRHAQEQCQLEWLCPGSVWAMDFTHPPHRIDGVFPAILNVRDLASHQQLLWLAVEHENAATVVDALADLFAVHGAPLVMKCDNGPAFRADVTKRFLLDQEVFTLYSPPYCARYNGACERANRTLKELTEHIADQAGRPGFWKGDDLLEARLRANRFSRPWGATGATPEQTWRVRGSLSLDNRQNMWQHLSSEIATVLNQRELDSTVALSHYTQAEIERLAAPPVLEQLGLLHVTRRRITPVF